MIIDLGGVDDKINRINAYKFGGQTYIGIDVVRS